MADDRILPTVSTDQPGVNLFVDGEEVTVEHPGGTLLDLLRFQLRVTEVKDGCSPQGQCGCCTVLVDGQPRVACVTPVRRVAGRQVTTLAGLDPDRRAGWAHSFTATGASQCGFCTPGIITRLDALSRKLDGSPDHQPVVRALAAHLCRCTGWQTVVEAWDHFHRFSPAALPPARETPVTVAAVGSVPAAVGSAPNRVLVERDREQAERATRRAGLEGGVPQRVGPEVALGQAGFAADEAPDGALVAVPDAAGGWAVGETLALARAAAGKVQGRRTTVHHSAPLAVPPGLWTATLATTWVEPAYLETDATWCSPGGEPYPLAANGGAFGAKVDSPATEAARFLADHHQRPVLALASREDTVRWGPKRPPVAGGARPDGTGVLAVVATPGMAQAVASVAPGLEVVEHQVPGPPVSAGIRAAGWAEALALVRAATGDDGPLTAPNGAQATARIDPDSGTIEVSVACGDPLDDVVLRSYCIGAAHMAWSWVTGEALSVDDEGQVHDLTIRSFGIVRAADTPPIVVTISPGDGPPINGSDAVFAAVASATWAHHHHPPTWPLTP